MDVTKELFDFLWSCPHREGRGISAGSVTEYIFEARRVKASK